MNKYNDKWTREKFIEYRKLKKLNYSHDMLKEYFGDDIYYSGLYNKKSNIIPYLDFITEITITPEYTDYKILKSKSDIYGDQYNDYLLKFEDKNTNYIIYLSYFIIDNINTYNILLTTENQWILYNNMLNNIRYKGYITDLEREDLIKIVEKETDYNQIYSVMKKVSYILLDFIKNHLNNITISIGETNRIAKINLYKNIIKNSFPNMVDLGYKTDTNNNKYYLYKIL